MKFNPTQIVTTLALAAMSVNAMAIQPKAATTTPKATVQKKMMMMESGQFKGIEVNAGKVIFTEEKGHAFLSLSPDFVIPKTPAPSWQVIDSKGNAYLLKQLRIKDDKTNLKIELPSYIRSVAKVQIWCSFAEVNLGEASFHHAIMIK